MDRKYAGKRTSRKKLVEDDDNSEEGTIKQTGKLTICMGAQQLSGRVLDSRQRGSVFKTHRHHCVVSLGKNINPSLVLVQPRKTRPFITERLLMGCKRSNQTNKNYLHAGKFCIIFLSSADSFQNQFVLKNSFSNTIRLSNSLDPDQVQHLSAWSGSSYQQMTLHSSR